MKLEWWTDENKLREVETAEVWNLTSRGAYTEEPSLLIKHLTEDTGLLKQWNDTLKEMDKKNFKLEGDGMDLGGGSGWISAILSCRKEIRSIYLVDISKIRLERMLPAAIQAFKGNAEKIKPAIGSFYEIRLPDSSIDFIVMNQSLHHAKYPLKLLCECNRILKKGGILLIAAEEPIAERLYCIKLIYRALKPIFKKGTKRDLRFRAIFPPSKMGDRHWRMRHYRTMFELTGFAGMKSYFPGYQHKNMSLFSKILGQRFYGSFYGLKREECSVSKIENISSENKTGQRSGLAEEILSDSEWSPYDY